MACGGDGPSEEIPEPPEEKPGPPDHFKASSVEPGIWPDRNGDGIIWYKPMQRGPDGVKWLLMIDNNGRHGGGIII